MLCYTLSVRGCCENLVACCSPDQPDGVQRTAAAAVANFAYQSLENQAQLGNTGVRQLYCVGIGVGIGIGIGIGAGTCVRSGMFIIDRGVIGEH